MFTKFKNYFMEKRDRKNTLYTALLLLLSDSSDFYRAQKEVLESTKQMNDKFDIEEIKKFAENINQFIQKPNLTEDFYQQIAQHAHEEKMAELKNKKDSNKTNKILQSN